MNEFITIEFLRTFAGLVAATALIVQFTKSIVKKRFGDISVRIYAFVLALILTFVFAGQTGLEGVIVTFINAILVTLSSIGGYEAIADPKAEKKRKEYN